MKKSTKTVIISIAIITIGSGIYGLLKGKDIQNVWFAFFIGITLLGSIYFDGQSN